jgi:hypothetical protein
VIGKNLCSCGIATWLVRGLCSKMGYMLYYNVGTKVKQGHLQEGWRRADTSAEA